MSVLDRYLYKESPIHALDPRVKLIVTVLYIVNNVALPDGAWWAYAVAWLVTLAISYRARLGVWFAARRSFIALPFMLAGFSVIFATPGTPIAEWRLGNLDLIVTDAGVIRLISLLLRTWLSVQMAILLTATTSFPDLTHALRHLKVPSVLVAIISFMYRYLFVLVDEAQRLLRARTSRSAEIAPYKAGGSLAWRAKVTGGMAGQLLVRSMDRGDRVYNAMLARGYRGQLLTMTHHDMTQRDWQSFAIGLLCLVAVQLIGRFL